MAKTTSSIESQEKCKKKIGKGGGKRKEED